MARREFEFQAPSVRFQGGKLITALEKACRYDGCKNGGRVCVRRSTMWKRALKWRGLRQIPEFGEGATFLRKWGMIGILIGVGAGLGALALTWSIDLVTRFVLSPITGYFPPAPGGEGGAGSYVFHMSRPWLLPVVT